MSSYLRLFGFMIKIDLASLVRDFPLAKIIGNPNFEITNISSSDCVKEGSLSWHLGKFYHPAPPVNSILISNSEVCTNGVNIVHPQPKLIFAYLAQNLLINLEDVLKEIHGNEPIVDISAQIASSAILFGGVKIGRNVKVGHNVVLYPGVELGDNVIIGSGTVLGSQGFGGVRWGNRILMLPHIGGVVVENNVRIGANCTIDSGTFRATVIGCESKFDNGIHLAHNCIIGESVFVTAGVKFSGSVSVGSNSWLGTGSVIKQKVAIGENVTVGIGSVVFKNIPDGSTVAGNPATDLKAFVRRNRK